MHIKQEREFVVKTETDIDEHPFILEDVKIQDSETMIHQLQDEKEKMIKDFVSIKGENQKLNLEIQRKNMEIEKLKQQQFTQESNFKKKINQLEAEMSDLKKISSADVDKRAQNDKTISKLNTENRELLARLKQVQQSANDSVLSEQNRSAIRNSTQYDSADEEFEVEMILNDRMVKGQREYLVRWKGYTAKYDLWVKKKDLSCSKILKEYMKMRK